MTHINTSGWLPNEGNPSVRVTPGVGDSLGEGEAPWAFPPGSPGAAGGPAVPDTFKDWLTSHDERLAVAWNPVSQRHVIWCRKKDGGWGVSVVMENPFGYTWADIEPGEPITKFDNRVKWLLMRTDPRSYGGEKKMWQAVVDRRDGIKASKEAETLDRMMDARDRAILHGSIRVGYGQSRSKIHEIYK